jgi:hypothetical protein
MVSDLQIYQQNRFFTNNDIVIWTQVFRIRIIWIRIQAVDESGSNPASDPDQCYNDNFFIDRICDQKPLDVSFFNPYTKFRLQEKPYNF